MRPTGTSRPASGASGAPSPRGQQQEVLPCPGDLRAAALGPCREAKALPTLPCPSDDLDRGDKAVLGAGAQSRVADGGEQPRQGSGSEAQVTSRAGQSVMPGDKF